MLVKKSSKVDLLQKLKFCLMLKSKQTNQPSKSCRSKKSEKLISFLSTTNSHISYYTTSIVYYK